MNKRRYSEWYIKLIEFPALFLSCPQGNSPENRMWENSKDIYYFEFSRSELSRSKDKREREREEIILFSVILYPVFLYTLVEIIQYVFYILKEYVGSLAT